MAAETPCRSRWRGITFLSKKKSDDLSRHAEKLRVNDDVMDFLAPSIAKSRQIQGSARRTGALPQKFPNTDTAAAQMWPGAHDVGKGSPSLRSPGSFSSSLRMGKEKRRPNLKVAFECTPPQIIGDGGEGATLPTVTVGNTRKTAPDDKMRLEAHGSTVGGSLPNQWYMESDMQSDDAVRRAHTVGHDAAHTIQQRQLDDHKSPPTRAPVQYTVGNDGRFEARPPNRAATGWSDVTEVESKGVTAKDDDVGPRRLPLTQTGFLEAQNDDSNAQPSFHEDDSFHVSQTASARTDALRYSGVPTLPEIQLLAEEDPTDFGWLMADKEHSCGASPSDPNSSSARLIHKMGSEEGKVFHEAVRNSMIMGDQQSQGGFDFNSFSMETSTMSPASGSHPAPGQSDRLQIAAVPPAKMPLSSNHSPAASIGQQSSGQRTPSPYMRTSGSGPNSHVPRSPGHQNPLPMDQPPPPGSDQHSHAYQQPPPIQPNFFSSQQSQPYQQRPTSQQRQVPSSPNPQLKSLAIRLGSAAGSLPSPTPTSARTSNGSSTPPNVTPTASTSSQIAAAGEAALEDFTDRVQHMSGVFRLMAEMIQPISRYTPKQWLRCCLWWFLRGRSGLEAIMRSRSRDSRTPPVIGSPGSRHGGEMMLTQAHVDLAKVTWMLNDVFPSLPALQIYALSGKVGLTTPAALALARDASDAVAVQVLEGLENITGFLKILLASCSRNDVMPPQASLIQGQDQSLWIQYQGVPKSVQAALCAHPSTSPCSSMPVSDTWSDFSFGRMFVDVTLSTPEARLNPMPCMLSIMRERNTRGLKVVICAQTEIFSVTIQDEHDGGKETPESTLPGPGWRDVNWDTQRVHLTVNMPQDGTSIMIACDEQDFMQLLYVWNYIRGVAASVLPTKDEEMLHEVVAVGLQFSDEGSPRHQQSATFPREWIKSCRVCVFAKYEYREQPNGLRKIQRGFRVLAATSPEIKALSTVSLEVGNGRPIACELVADNAGGESGPALVLRVAEQSRQATMAIMFHDHAERKQLLDVFTGISLRSGETILYHSKFTMLGIEPAGQAAAFTQSSRDPLRGIRWQDITVIGEDDAAPRQSAEVAQMITCENFRIVARASGVVVTERLSLTQGELKLRLPPTGSSSAPSASVSVFRPADPAPSTTITCLSSGPRSRMPDVLSPLLTIAMTTATIETFHFASLPDLHAFEAALTCHTVLFDGLSSGFTVSHRRSMVPLHKKQHAHDVRVQVVKRDRDPSALLLSFFEQYKLTDAMAFKMLSTDSFETIDGAADGKGKKASGKETGGAAWGVKLIDAKFAMPALRRETKEQKDKGDGDRGWRMRRRPNGSDGSEGGRDLTRCAERFVSLELLEFPGEHDDIVIAFDGQKQRDSFLAALPAGPQVSRGLGFKRKI